MKRICFFIFTLIAVVLPVRSQSAYDSNTLNPKVKQQVITFKEADKIIVGHVDKKEFVSGQYIAIYNYPFNRDKDSDIYMENGRLVVKQGKETTSIAPFLSGIYYGNASIPYIKGELYDGEVTMKGSFCISNMSDSDEPKLSPVTKGKWQRCDSSIGGLVSQTMRHNGVRYFNISPAPDAGQIEISARNVPFDMDSKTPCFDISAYGRGNNFRISAIPTNNIENIDSLTFTASGFPNMCQGLSASVIDILKLSDEEPTIYYHNGDTFTESIRDMKPYEGIYHYHTGEILEGHYHPVGVDVFRYSNVNCKVTFNDGTVAEDEWLKQYDKPLYDITTLKPNVRFEDEDWKELDRCTTWTEMRDIADDRYQFRLQEIQQSEISEKQKKDEKRDELIAKYGQKYEQSPEIGDMVETAVYAQWFPRQNAELRYANWRQGRQQGEVDLVGLDISRQKPYWAVEIKWSDLFFNNPGDLKSLNHFMDSNKLKEALVTTVKETGWKDLNEKKVYFIPVACYAYVVGENTINQSKSYYGV